MPSASWASNGGIEVRREDGSVVHLSQHDVAALVALLGTNEMRRASDRVAEHLARHSALGYERLKHGIG